MRRINWLHTIALLLVIFISNKTYSQDLPDFTVDIYSVTPPNPSIGTAPIIRINTSNVGTSDYRSVGVVCFYLSHKTYYDATATYIGNQYCYTTLAGGDSYVYNVTSVTIPSGTSLGQWYLLAFIDGYYGAVESNENNNVDYISITVTENTLLPDLTLSIYSASPSTINVGENTTLVFNLSNTGDATADANTTKFYLSSNTTYENYIDEYLGEYNFGSINPGSNSTTGKTFTIPSGINAGTWYIVGKCDANNEITESNENNNTAYTQVEITADIDLFAEITGITPFSLIPGESLNLGFRLSNFGTDDAASSDMKFYISSNSTFESANDTYLTSYSCPSLLGGSNSTANLNLTIPGSLNSGTWYILGIADANNVINETNENNNISYEQIVLLPKPDLFIVSANANPSYIFDGETTSLTFTTIGSQGDAGPSRTKFYLSSNTIYDSGSDILLGYYDLSNIYAGDVIISTKNITIPSGTGTGIKYILCITDANNEVDESSESNNIYSVQVNINQVPAPTISAEPDCSTGSITIHSGLSGQQSYVLSTGTSCGTVINSVSVDASSYTFTNLPTGTYTAFVVKNGTYSSCSEPIELSNYEKPTVTLEKNDNDITVSSDLTILQTFYLSDDNCNTYIDSHTDDDQEYTFLNLPDGTYSAYILNVYKGCISECSNVVTVVNRPDLFIVSTNANPSYIFDGESTTLTITLVNGSSGTAGSSRAKFYLSTDNIFNAGDIYLGYHDFDSLSPSDVVTITKNVTIPVGTNAGDWNVLCLADADNTVTESNENNNSSYDQIRVNNIPANYYDGTEGLEEEALKAVLNDIIKGHTIYTYTSTLTDTWDILKESDADPNNPSNVILVYSGRSVNGPQEYNDGAGWTREHTWPNSRGDFGTVRGPGTDLHNLKPCDVSVNSARSNRWFDFADVYYYDDGVNTGSKTSYTDFVWEPRDEVKGDVARIIFYMATRYEGEDGELDLEVVNYFPADDSSEPLMALLHTLKEWHEMDPVDDFERNRNEVIYSYQNNRNPFIDHPEFVEKIWGPVISESEGLFISEYIEGDSYDKAIEIYNNSESTIDLSNVKLQKDNGGDQSFSYSLSLSGTINPHDVFVIAHNSASAEIRAKADLTTTSLVMTFNGDDQLRILYNGIETDHIGDVGNFGENRTFVRAGHVLKGDTSLVNPQLSLNWIELDKGDHSCLGYHYTKQTLITPQLFISEYIEGSGYNKGIEIFNASNEAIDLNNVAILKQTNGLEGFSGFTLSGELNPYSVYCIVHTSAQPELIEKSDLQTIGGVLDFNGNDPVMLVYKGVSIDKIGNSGGTNFAIDKGLLRNSSQDFPSKEWNVIEWNNIALDDFSYFGEHEYRPLLVNIELNTASFPNKVLVATPVGGVQPYSYLWSIGYTEEAILTNGKGIYSVKVTDAIGQEAIQTYDFENTTNTFDHNFIKSESILVAGAKTESAVNNLNIAQRNVTFSYLDDLGRKTQTVAVKASPSYNDIVQHIEYDKLGRQVREYLPYAASSEYGAFHEDAVSEQRNFHFVTPDIANSAYPYSEKVFDDSPLNRVLEQGAPGADWQPQDATIANSGHTNKNEFLTNTDDDQVIIWTVNSFGYCDGNGYYPKNKLFKSVVQDENGNTVEIFKDFTGKEILKKAYNTIINPDGSTTDEDLLTYYAYDVFGQLRYVLPPLASELLSSNSYFEYSSSWTGGVYLKDLIYYYEYDNRGRQIVKQIPGSDPIFMVYDKRDRLVLSQDGELRLDRKWAFTKYDKLNRAIMKGVVEIVDYDRAQLAILFNNHSAHFEDVNTGLVHGYTLNNSYPASVPVTANDIMSVSYYDNYNFRSISGYPNLAFDNVNNIDAYSDNDGVSNGYFDHVFGQITGTKTLALDDSATPNWLYDANYYDDKLRMIQSVSTNYTGGNDIVSIEYDFVGKVLTSRHEQSVNFGTVETMVEYTYNTYDHAGHLLKTEHQLGENAANKKTLAEMGYNENGQLKEKNIAKDDDGKFQQSVDIKYNIRGWTESINDPCSPQTTDAGDDFADLFDMQFYFNKPVAELGQTNLDKQYNGNIAGVKWAHKGDDIQSYAYTYDNLNRMLTANYGDETAGWTNPEFDVLGRNGEGGISYDKHGNILSLGRKSETGTWRSNLQYRYKGNQLMALGVDGTTVDPSIDDYIYNKNGNMVQDDIKGLTVNYNVLNLPEEVNYGGSNYIKYIYSAGGQKLAQDIYVAGSLDRTTDYVGNIIYKDGSFEYLLTSEGRVNKPTSDFVYEYQLKDHQGNVRVAFEADAAGPVVTQKSDFYPFGLRFAGMLNNDNKYLYNGKEWQEGIDTDGDGDFDLPLDWYDYGFRMY
ncbi:MAG TPA: hypothetical protein DCG75_05130, partial [Bacteroidales bacterium]|nr:hypothetical protein [Bacteroidales bacterium]